MAQDGIGNWRYQRHWRRHISSASGRGLLGVAATCAGNAEAAKAFASRTGISAHQWDIGDFDACATGVKAVEASVGPIDILVNNAGIVRDATFHKMTQPQWDAVIRTNLDGVFNMCRQVIDGMRARRYGRIINVSSINGQKGQFGQTNYSAAIGAETHCCSPSPTMCGTSCSPPWSTPASAIRARLTDKLRSALTTFLDIIAADPRIHRIATGDVSSVPGLTEHRTHILDMITGLIVQHAPDVLPSATPSLPQLRRGVQFMVGGVNQIIEAWLSAPTETTEELAAECADLCVAVVRGVTHSGD